MEKNKLTSSARREGHSVCKHTVLFRIRYLCRFESPIIHCCGFSYLLTCGSDGDVRIYKDFDDSDPESVRAGENATVLVVKVHACKLKNFLYWVKLKEY